MRALYIWGTLVACLSIVNRDDFEPLAISDEELLETRDADALSNEEDFSPMKAMKISVGGGARGGGGSIGGAGRGGGGSSGSAGRGGGSSSGSSGRGGGDSSGSAGRGGGGSSGSAGQGGGGSSGSSGRGGGDSSGSAGRGGAGGSKGGQGSSGYGKNSRPDRSEDSSPPPPYSKGDNAPPPPYSRGSYGQTGPSRSYWNGQYYPYRSYGYGGFFPFLGLGAAAPLLLAGPFGLYGHYCGGSRSDNCTVKKYYVNGTRNDTGSSEINLVNGTYYEIVWQDSTYELRSQVGGVYRNAQLLDTDQNIAVNGTYAGNSSSWESKTINPNVTSNGTTLESSDNSGAASLRTPPVYVSLGAIAVTALLT